MPTKSQGVVVLTAVAVMFAIAGSLIGVALGGLLGLPLQSASVAGAALTSLIGVIAWSRPMPPVTECD